MPGLSDPAAIAAPTRTLTVPLNVLHTPDGPALAQLAAPCARRVGLGPLLHRTAPVAAVATARAVRGGESAEPPAATHAEVQRPATGDRRRSW
ncbi:hypothetical protein [Streptomyces sp. NPDC006610]|uniref:hypothetical protein n=1 Tax=Streptomyces sp. NPDC006610 TaxID=3154584 RepID=UPI0033B21EA7